MTLLAQYMMHAINALYEKSDIKKVVGLITSFVIAKSLIVGASKEAGEGQKKKKKKKKNTGKSAL